MKPSSNLVLLFKPSSCIVCIIKQNQKTSNFAQKEVQNNEMLDEMTHKFLWEYEIQKVLYSNVTNADNFLYLHLKLVSI